MANVKIPDDDDNDDNDDNDDAGVTTIARCFFETYELTRCVCETPHMPPADA